MQWLGPGGSRVYAVLRKWFEIWERTPKREPIWSNNNTLGTEKTVWDGLKKPLTQGKVLEKRKKTYRTYSRYLLYRTYSERSWEDPFVILLCLPNYCITFFQVIPFGHKISTGVHQSNIVLRVYDIDDAGNGEFMLQPILTDIIKIGNELILNYSCFPLPLIYMM